MIQRDLPGPGDRLAEEAAAAVRRATDVVPLVGVILGSGLGPAVGNELKEFASFPFAELPGFAPAGVPGHEGRLAVGELAGVPVAAFFGRVHLYEGHGIEAPAMLPRLAHSLGASILLLTAAVGGLRPGMPAGTIVVLTDHINHMGTTPLRGWRFPDGTPAFIAMRDPYDPALSRLALERAEALGIRAEPGVYGAMAGPAYETPSENIHLQQTGATVVGMSVVPEAVPARALGMRVVGLCTVTNAFGEDVSHEEVLRVSSESAKAVGRLLVDMLPRMAESGQGA